VRATSSGVPEAMIRPPPLSINRRQSIAAGPGVAVGLDHLKFSGEVAFLVLHIPFPDFRLEIGGKLDPVGQVRLDHLDLSGQIPPVGRGLP